MADEKSPLSVTQAVLTAKESVNALPPMMVMGEVSGFRGPNARSGHCYFEVKDDQSSMSAIVWRGVYEACGFVLKDGLKIQLFGGFDVYKGSGRLSFVAKRIQLEGEGLLRQRVAELARKLEREGLMDPARKRRIPRFCTRVAVVTSLSGSVIDDVKRTLARRNPLVELLVVGCSVQGPGAPQSIIQALQVAAGACPDAILLVRGGGSFEDLMTFNDEALARAVAACPVPVVTGIGHEPDNSICDMVSDRRQSTPTAAAESVAPAMDELSSVIADRARRLERATNHVVSREREALDARDALMAQIVRGRLAQSSLELEALARRRCLASPFAMFEDRGRELVQTEQRLLDALPRTLARMDERVSVTDEHLRGVAGRLLRPYEAQLAKSAGSLEALSPLKVLSRGYSIVRDDEGHVLADATEARVGGDVSVMMGKGSLVATVKSIEQ